MNVKTTIGRHMTTRKANDKKNKASQNYAGFVKRRTSDDFFRTYTAIALEMRKAPYVHFLKPSFFDDSTPASNQKRCVLRASHHPDA
jgi:hypothetical protein